jgi:hypothetical protein
MIKGRVPDEELRIELWGHLHPLFLYPGAAQGDPTVCQGNPRDRARFSANDSVVVHGDCNRDRSRRGFACATGSDELACLTPAVSVTTGIILFYQALTIIMQAPAAASVCSAP